MPELPDDFDEWEPRAQRVYIAESMTQKESLVLAVERLDLDVSLDTEGPLTNRELAAFVSGVLSLGEQK